MGAKIKRNKSVFLRAEWRKLLMANFIVPPEILEQYLPAGTELDYYEGNCYVSMVGFMFLNTAIKGWRIPWHQNFEEVNLRFYVRRKVGDEWRRGAVFIKEIVPKPAISIVANTVYGENYVTRHMKHTWEHSLAEHRVSYEWKPFTGRKWNEISANHSPKALPIAAGSEAEFITEHYWGYAKKGRHRTMEYEVCHPRWDVYNVDSFQFHGRLADEYGLEFAEILSQTPNSVFLAEGSAIEILQGTLLRVD